MRFFNSPALVLGSLLAASGALAAPAANNLANTLDAVAHDQIKQVANWMDSKGKIKWKQVKGGRLCHISHKDGLAAMKEMGPMKSQRDEHALVSRTTDWFDIPQILGLNAQAACYESGPQYSTDKIKDFIGPACDAILAGSGTGAYLDAGWWLYQISGLQDIQGNSMNFEFKFQDIAKALTHPMQKVSCTDALQALWGSKCATQKTGDDAKDDGWTWGGVVKILDEWVVGFDPNDN